MQVIEALPKQLALMFEKGVIVCITVTAFYYIKNRAKLKSYDFCVASMNSVLSVVLVSNGRMLDGDN